MGDRYVKSDEKKNDVLYGCYQIIWSFNVSTITIWWIKFDRNVCSKDKLNTPNDSDKGYFLEVDLGYSHNTRQKAKHFPFAPEYKIMNEEDFNEHMKKN